MVPVTRVLTVEVFDHMTQNVFGWDPNTPSMKDLAYEGYNKINDLVTMTDEEVEKLTEYGTKKIPHIEKNLLLHYLLYYDKEKNITDSTFSPDDWKG